MIKLQEENKNIVLGERMLNEGDCKGAISKFNTAIKEDPENPSAYFGKAEASIGVPHIAANDIITLYKKAIELDPSNAFYYTRLGAFCLDGGLFNDAEEHYNTAAQLDPEGAKYYYSEFGVEYYNSAISQLDEEADNTKVDEIRKKALVYLLKTLDITEEDIIKLLSKK